MHNARTPWSWIILILALLGTNLSLLVGHPNEGLIFDGARIADGEWWRLLTYPLAHVSLYHWILDVSAFMVLWAIWQTPSWFTRIGTLLCCSAGSLLGAIAWSPELWQTGLGGLSGVGHGLMTVVALEQMRAPHADPGARFAGFACLTIVIAKSIIEASTGSVVLSGMHQGDLGVPIAACHLGGVLGGLVASPRVRNQSWIDVRHGAGGGIA